MNGLHETICLISMKTYGDPAQRVLPGSNADPSGENGHGTLNSYTVGSIP